MQYSTSVETQSPNNYKKKLQTGWELCDKEHKGVEFWVSNKRKRSHSSLFACGCTSMKSIQALLSKRASHYLKLLIINDLNIISWEETIIALRTQPLPPAWISKLFTTREGWFFFGLTRVNLINVRYDLARIEGYLGLIRSLKKGLEDVLLPLLIIITSMRHSLYKLFQLGDFCYVFNCINTW